MKKEYFYSEIKSENTYYPALRDFLKPVMYKEEEWQYVENNTYIMNRGIYDINEAYWFEDPTMYRDGRMNYQITLFFPYIIPQEEATKVIKAGTTKRQTVNIVRNIVIIHIWK